MAQRPTRDYCLRVFEEYKKLDLNSFTSLIKSFAGYDENASSEFQGTENSPERKSHFAQRLITGLAAEQYFESIQPSLAEFRGYSLQNTTRLGCGYDFRLQIKPGGHFLAVEVKGLKEATGALSFTPKEHEIAKALGDDFFLFVVKNFRETPFHEVFRNPLSSALQFKRMERLIMQVSWITTV